VFVKNPNASQHGQIYFHDIGDYLDQKEKLAIVSNFGSIGGIAEINGWSKIDPNDHHDWIGQRGQDFGKFLPISAKDGLEPGLFETHSAGLKTNRDVWVYDSSKDQLESRTRASIGFFNHQVDLRQSSSEYVIDTEPTKFKWCQATIRSVEKGKKIEFQEQVLQQAMYRPFLRTWVYKHKSLNWSSYLMPRFFPEASTKNLAICASGPGGRGNFSALMTDAVPSIHFADVDGVQCYPLRVFSGTPDEVETDLFASAAPSKEGKDGITDTGLKHFQDAYPHETITKEALFYYVYGLLHSEDYRAKYADNLSKELPRIPRVKTAADFWAFSRAGRELGDLHVNYETVEPYPVTIKQGDLRLADIKNPEAFYRVTKWAFGKAGKEKDKTTVIYNANITMQDVPLEAYDYVVNGKPALEWVMERQVVKTDKDSGIENDANRYAIETMNNPAYPLELFQRVITVSLRTMEIVRGLPKLEVMA
jgi:predicted helicase